MQLRTACFAWNSLLLKNKQQVSLTAHHTAHLGMAGGKSRQSISKLSSSSSSGSSMYPRKGDDPAEAQQDQASGLECAMEPKVSKMHQKLTPITTLHCLNADSR